MGLRRILAYLRVLNGTTMTPKREKQLRLLQQVQEDLYDADQAFGVLRVTKETASTMGRGLDKIHQADLKITKVIEGWE